MDLKTEQVIEMLGGLREKETLTAEERQIIREANDLLVELAASKKKAMVLAPEDAPNINDLSWEELLAVTGIGVTRCRNIVDHRKKTGKRYESPQDLLEVWTIGIEMAARVAEKVNFG